MRITLKKRFSLRLVLRAVASIAPAAFIIGLLLFHPPLKPLAQSNVQTLALGQPVERRLKGGESQWYQITLTAKQFLHVIATQRGIDVTIIVTGPDGKQMFEVNGRKDETGDEIVALVAEASGRYRLEVRASDKEAEVGTYTMRVEAQRTATTADRQRAEAEQAMREGERLRGEAKPEVRRTALAQFQSALATWRKLGDRAREADTLFALGRVHLTLREPQQTLDYGQQALSVWRAIADQAGESETLILLGAAQDQMRKYPEAIAVYQQALTINQTAGRTRQQARLLSSIGNAYAGQNDFRQAVNFFSQAIPLLRQLNDHKEEARQLSLLIRLHERLKDHARAVETFNQARAAYEKALTASRAAQDRESEVTLLSDLADAAYNVFDDDKAIEYWRQTLPLWRELKKPENEAATLNRLGVALRGKSQIQEARDSYQQALAIWRQLKDQTREIQVLNNLANATIAAGDQRQALTELQRLPPLLAELKLQAQEAATRDRIKVQEAEVLNTLGVVYANLGENEQALTNYGQALKLWRELNRQDKEATLLQNIGETHDRMGDKQQALDLYNQALEHGDLQTRIAILTNLGTLYASLGDQEQATTFYNQALDLLRTSKDRRGLADQLHLIGYFRFKNGDYEQAQNYLNQALTLWQEVKDKRGEANTLFTLGAVFSDQGDQAKALQFIQQSLPLHRAVGNRAGEANALTALARVHERQGNRTQAIQDLNEALPLAKAVNDALSETDIRYELARINLLGNDLNAARTQIEETLRIVEALRVKVVSQQLRASYLATTHKYYDLYIDLLMRLNERRPGEEFDSQALQVSERARARSLIELLAEANANIRRGADPELLARERDLRQRLNGKASNLFYLETHRDSDTKMAASQDAQIAALKKESIEISTELEQVQTLIRQKSSSYAALTQPQPLSVKEIQTLVLDNDTLLLEYALGEERSFLWAVTKDSVQSYALPRRSEIEAVAQKLYPLLSTKPNKARLLITKKSASVGKESNDELQQTATQLSRMILGPVSAQLRKADKKRLLIVADGALQYIPFAALPRPHRNGNISSKPLIVEYEIVTLPSASTLAVLRHELQGRPLAPKTLAVLADPVFDKNDDRVKGSLAQTDTKSVKQTRDAFSTRILKTVSARAKAANQPTAQPASPQATKPAEVTAPSDEEYLIERLPGTRQEAENILALTPSNTSLKALDFNADRSLAASDELRQYRFVHFATHGYLDSQQPELSALVFSLVDNQGRVRDGFLRAHEIYNLNLPVELVVLSACETGLGKEVKGEGLVGLTRGFMYAGAARVVVSLWAVSDHATEELMTRFYRKMLHDGQRPAAALRSAQIELWKLKQWQAPYYWAAFGLQGEWR